MDQQRIVWKTQINLPHFNHLQTHVKEINRSCLWTLGNGLLGKMPDKTRSWKYPRLAPSSRLGFSPRTHLNQRIWKFRSKSRKRCSFQIQRLVQFSQPRKRKIAPWLEKIRIIALQKTLGSQMSQTRQNGSSPPILHQIGTTRRRSIYWNGLKINIFRNSRLCNLRCKFRQPHLLYPFSWVRPSLRCHQTRQKKRTWKSKILLLNLTRRRPGWNRQKKNWWR